MYNNGRLTWVLIDPLPDPSAEFNKGADIGEAVELPLGEVKVPNETRILPRCVVYTFQAEGSDYLKQSLEWKWLTK